MSTQPWNWSPAVPARRICPPIWIGTAPCWNISAAYADYISLHRYVGNPSGDSADFLAVTNSIDQQIEEMDAVCRFVQARNRSKKRHYLCFDEWNVWYRAREAEHMNGRGTFAPHLIEEEYNLEDALVVAGFFNSFIRHADVLKIANIAQIVNVIAPILTRGDEMLLQTIYYPFLMYAQRRDGISLQPVVKGPGYESASYGYVNDIDTSAILGDGLLHVFLVNRSLEESAAVEIHYPGGQLNGVESAEIITGANPDDRNTFEQPSANHQPTLLCCHSPGWCMARLEIPALSVVAVSFTCT